MASHKLPNYLRSHRKRLALSQHEMAFLLGSGTPAAVSRYEAFLREPGLRQVLAYLLILHKPVHELFAGLYVKVGKEVAIRARVLLARKSNQGPNRKTEQKRKMLNEILIRYAAILPKPS